MTDRGVLGLLDWGIGGLGVLRALRAVHPHATVIYLSDTGSTPYGKLSREPLRARVELALRFLVHAGAQRILVACNAASTALPSVRGITVPTSGMIEHGVRAVGGRKGLVAVVGGARTIRSGVYGRALAAPSRTVVQRIAQPLSAHIEAGRLGTPEFESDLEAIVRPLRDSSALLLACTHYPAAHASFARRLPGVALIDPAESAAESLARERFDDAPSRFFTTGDPDAMRVSARHAWAMELPWIERVSLGV